MTNRMGPQAPGQAHPNHAAPVLPAPLAEVALIDAPACAAAGSMSVSWWHQQVADGHAPQPVIRKPRCTRWRLADVRAFWLKSAELADTQTGERVTAQAKKASAHAKAKRAAAAPSQAAAG